MQGRLTTRCRHKLFPIAVTNDWRTLGSTVTHSEWEVNVFQEHFYFAVQGCSTDDNLIDVTTEGLHYLFANLLFYLLLNYRCVQQQLHAVGLNLGEHTLANNLLDNERYGYHKRRLHFGKCLCDDCRRRHTCQVEDMGTCNKLEDKFESHTIHVCHWQNADNVASRLNGCAQYAACKVGIAPHGTIRNHYTLRVSSSSAGVIDKCQLVWTLLTIVVNMLGTEVLRVLLSKHFVEMFACVCKFFGTAQREREVGKIDNAFECGHLRSVNFRCNDIAHKEYLRFRVVYDVVYLFWRKLVQNGYRHCSVCKGCQESSSPH